jgi:hypothetical protein
MTCRCPWRLLAYLRGKLLVILQQYHTHGRIKGHGRCTTCPTPNFAGAYAVTRWVWERPYLLYKSWNWPRMRAGPFHLWCVRHLADDSGLMRYEELTNRQVNTMALLYHRSQKLERANAYDITLGPPTQSLGTHRFQHDGPESRRW